MSFDEIDCALVLESRTIYQKPQDLFLYGISNHASPFSSFFWETGSFLLFALRSPVEERSSSELHEGLPETPVRSNISHHS